MHSTKFILSSLFVGLGAVIFASCEKRSDKAPDETFHESPAPAENSLEDATAENTTTAKQGSDGVPEKTTHEFGESTDINAIESAAPSSDDSEVVVTEDIPECEHCAKSQGDTNANPVAGSTEAAADESKVAVLEETEAATDVVEPTIPDILNTPAVMGTWKSWCKVTEKLKGSRQISFNIDSAGFVKEVQLFEDEMCKNLTVSFQSSGSAKITGAKESFLSAVGEVPFEKDYDVELNFTKIVVTPHADAGVKLLESGAIRGMKSCLAYNNKLWTVGQGKDLTPMAGVGYCIFEKLPQLQTITIRREGLYLDQNYKEYLGQPFKATSVQYWDYDSHYANK